MLLTLAALDQTIVTTALPTIISELGELKQISWIVTSYLLSSTIVSPLYGKLGDMYGRKIMMQIAIIVFLIGSFLSGISINIEMFIVSRVIQGMGGGGLFVLAFTVVGDIVPSRSRGKIQGLFAVVFGMSSILGPLIGGFFVEEISWGWIFFINIPIGIISLIILNFTFPKMNFLEKKSIDYIGIFLLTSIIFLIILFTNDVSNFFITKNWPIAFILIILLITFFIFWEKKNQDPIFPIKLFTEKNFFIYSFIGFFSGGILFSLLIFIPFYFQILKSSSPTESGIYLIPLTIGIITGAWTCGLIMTRYGKYKFLPTIGSIVMISGLIGLIITTYNNSINIISFFLFIIGIGLGPQLSVITTIIQNGAPTNQMGVSTSTLILMRQIGGNVSIAIFSLIFIQKIKIESLLNKLVDEKKINIFNLDRFKMMNLSKSDKLYISEILDKGFEMVFVSLLIISLIIFCLSFFGVEKELSKTSHNQKK